MMSVMSTPVPHLWPSGHRCSTLKIKSPKSNSYAMVYKNRTLVNIYGLVSIPVTGPFLTV